MHAHTPEVRLHPGSNLLGLDVVRRLEARRHRQADPRLGVHAPPRATVAQGGCGAAGEGARGREGAQGWADDSVQRERESEQASEGAR